MPKKPKVKKIKVELRPKTYKERADYLSEIYPTRASVFQGIAQFFGEHDVPPRPHRVNK